jgi:hypothetical protein
MSVSLLGFLGCVVALLTMFLLFYSGWKCWKNADGIVTMIRKHLKGTHSEEYKHVCNLLKLKHADKPTDSMPNKSTSEPFNLEEWLRRLVKWIVVDDQVFLIHFSLLII